jgi:hypothetical protein
MFRFLCRLLPVPVLAAAMLLGACTSSGQFTNITIESVQQAAVNACKFLPTAKTVTDIIASGVPGLSTATAIGDAICAAVLPSNQASRAATPQAASIGGIPIQGAFVK